MKVTVGKHRPDFLARCNPMLMGLPVVKDIPLRLWTVRVCSQPDHHILKDGMRSFPSGHASTSFAGLTYISLWMAGKMRVFDRRGYSLKVVLLIVPILAALLVSISRIQDYRHAGVDVTWGGIIGIIFAIFAYLQYYPSPTSPYPDVPNPPRHLPWMPRNNEGQGAGSSRLENATGIQHNHDLVDESRHVQNNSVYEGQAYNDDGARVGTTVQRDRAV
ncbi:hypothetical protein BX616_006512 [Lobosporangium transversale]|nr:hypothetical protein BX616_006512 [Lobosporangium transversale]